MLVSRAIGARHLLPIARYVDSGRVSLCALCESVVFSASRVVRAMTPPEEGILSYNSGLD
jgi:hypothetical protein